MTGGMARALYEKDVVRWAQEQARLLREGDFAHLDIEHVADEIEDVGKAEQRELASRMAVLLTHLLKWRFQPQLRSNSWRATIDIQRRSIARRLVATPSLKATLRDKEWRDDIWLDALKSAIDETGLDPALFPPASPWATEQALDPEFWPEQE
jgi:ribosomal protein L29